MPDDIKLTKLLNLISDLTDSIIETRAHINILTANIIENNNYFYKKINYQNNKCQNLHKCNRTFYNNIEELKADIRLLNHKLSLSFESTANTEQKLSYLIPTNKNLILRTQKLTKTTSEIEMEILILKNKLENLKL